MRIGVEMSAVGDLLQVRVRELVGERREVVLDPAHWRDRIDLDPLYTLGGEDFVRRVSVDHARDQDVRERRERPPKGGGIARFGAVIELVNERTLDLLHDPDQIDARARRSVLREERRELSEELD